MRPHDPGRHPLRSAALRSVRRSPDSGAGPSPDRHHQPAARCVDRRFNLFDHDTTVALLARFGIVALFLFAGLEIEVGGLRAGARVLEPSPAIPSLLRRRFGIRGHRPRGRCGAIIRPKGGPQHPHLARHVGKHGGSHQRPLGSETLPRCLPPRNGDAQLGQILGASTPPMLTGGTAPSAKEKSWWSGHVTLQLNGPPNMGEYREPTLN